MDVQQTMNLAAEHLRAGRLVDAERLFREVVAKNPSHADALHLLGCTLSKMGRPGDGEEMVRRAIGVNPREAVYFNNLGFMFLLLGKRREAMEPFRRAVALKPDMPMTLIQLGNIHAEIGEIDEAIKCFESAARLLPREAGVYFNLGNCWARKGHEARMDGETGVEAAAKTRNEFFQRAIVCFQRALELAPAPADIGNNLGNVYQAMGRTDEAIAMWRRVVAAGAHPLAYYNLGRALYEKDLIDDAIEATQTAIAMLPNSPDGYNNLGNLFRQSARIEESVAQFEKATQIRPDYSVANSNRLYTLYYHPDVDAVGILAEHRKWNDAVARKFAPRESSFANDRSPDRRLKIGYVSPNFWGHCQAFFTTPLFANHDHGKFEIFCYSDVKVPDAATAKIRGWADHWRSIVGMSDEAVAEMIRRDGIDILVDLTMHMAENRMLLFARKPAPVQVTWLGYPGTSGLEVMDYRLTDPYLDPQPGPLPSPSTLGEGQGEGLGQSLDEDHPHPNPLPEYRERGKEAYTERSIRLPHTFWCLDRESLESPEIPAVNELPAKRNGFVTFGCLNNFCKLNQPLLELWKRVLDGVKDSRMVILAPLGSRRDWVRKTLGNRVDFVQRQPRAKYLAFYNRIDIGLDTLPYNGHTTSLDSLWMGVPVVTMIGKTVVGRAGFSQLSNLGLTELVANAEGEFVEIAAKLAGDWERLLHLRSSLRDRMRGSALMDGKRFAGGVEKAFRGMWRRYCEGE